MRRRTDGGALISVGRILWIGSPCFGSGQQAAPVTELRTNYLNRLGLKHALVLAFSKCVVFAGFHVTFEAWPRSEVVEEYRKGISHQDCARRTMVT
jgi:hypothetical protein